MAYSNGSLLVHCVAGTGYAGRPPIYMTINVGDVTRSGNTLSVTISSAWLNALVGSQSFGYTIGVSAQLDNGTRQTLITKGTSPSQWNAQQIVMPSPVTLTSTNTTTSASFKIYFESNCGQLEGGGTCTSSPNPVVVFSTAFSAPPANVTITFDLDGGTRTGGGQLTQTVPIGGNATLPECVRANCDFVRWDGTYTNVQSSGTVTAIWDYHIDYVCTGTEYYLEQQIKHKNENINLHDIILDRPGYEFSGWGTSETATTVSYHPGDVYSANAPITLYALWGASQETFTVTFDLNGGTTSGGGALVQTIQYGHDATPPNDPKKPGRRFAGWLGNYRDVISDRTIKALWDSSPLWIFTGTEWIPFSS